MMLQIFYKNGEIRKTNLDIGFFRDDRISISVRAQDMAFMHNPYPWKIFVIKDGEVKFQKIMEQNEPDAIKDAGKIKLMGNHVPQNHKKIRKEAKRKYKLSPAS
jgi:hypothetical protein